MQLPILRQFLEAYVECEQANLVDIVTDECGQNLDLDRLLDDFARRLIGCATADYVRPPSFYSVAGGKLIRDELWSSLRVVFQADDRYFRTHGLYDFPRRSLKTWISDGLLTLMLKIPSFRREFRKKMKEGMIKPLAKVLEDV